MKSQKSSLHNLRHKQRSTQSVYATTRNTWNTLVREERWSEYNVSFGEARERKLTRPATSTRRLRNANWRYSLPRKAGYMQRWTHTVQGGTEDIEKHTLSLYTEMCQYGEVTSVEEETDSDNMASRRQRPRSKQHYVVPAQRTDNRNLVKRSWST